MLSTELERSPAWVEIRDGHGPPKWQSVLVHGLLYHEPCHFKGFSDKLTNWFVV